MSVPPAIRRYSERDFQRDVVKLARLCGWMAYHTHNSRRSEPGFPDLVLVRERVVFAELKDEKGKPTDAQLAWLDALDKAGGETYLWRPSMMDEVVAILTERRPA